MRALLLLISILAILPWAAAQDYKPKAGETVVKLEIEGRGNIYIRLFKDKAPKTTDHIERLVKQGFYDGQRFHIVDRSPKPYLVQTGDPLSKTLSLDDAQIGTGGSGSKVPYEETGLPNVEGAVGLSRALDDKNSGDSQFYIVIGPSRFLDGRYTVFGKVATGMDVVNRIKRGDRITAATVLVG